MGKQDKLPISEITHYNSLKEYANARGMGWRFAKKKVIEGKILLFMIRKGRVFIDSEDLKNFLLLKLTNAKESNSK